MCSVVSILKIIRRDMNTIAKCAGNQKGEQLLLHVCKLASSKNMSCNKAHSLHRPLLHRNIDPCVLPSSVL